MMIATSILVGVLGALYVAHVEGHLDILFPWLRK